MLPKPASVSTAVGSLDSAVTARVPLSGPLYVAVLTTTSSVTGLRLYAGSSWPAALRAVVSTMQTWVGGAPVTATWPQ